MDCSPIGPSAPKNICADIQQHASGGSNVNRLRQSVNQDENSTGVATQSQGRSDGGLDGHVHQDTVSPGKSINAVAQSKKQHQKAAAGSSQSQWDPISCCGFASQLGGIGNKETINQSSSLDSGPGAFQRTNVEGTSRTPDGTCVVRQHASVNGGKITNSDTVTPCPYLLLVTRCSSGNGDASVNGGSNNCTALTPDTTDPNPPDGFLTKLVRNNSDSGFDNSTGSVSGGTVEYDLVYSDSSEAGPADGVVVTDVSRLD